MKEAAMKTLQKGGETGRRLLAAAADVFAAKGFRDATVQEICRQAGANIAAINYHFGSKAILYAESWRYAFTEAINRHPPDGGVAADATAEERLRGQIAGLLHRISDENNKEFRIARKEMTHPTGFLEDVMIDEVWPLHRRLETVVSELLGAAVTRQRVQYAVMSVVSQCLEPVIVNREQKEGVGTRKTPSVINDMERYIEHVFQFSLGGIKAIRVEAEAKRTSTVTKGKKLKSRKA